MFISSLRMRRTHQTTASFFPLLCPSSYLLSSSSRNTFAYATSDNVVYLRGFGLASGDMVLLGSLQGHHSEVTQVRDYPL